MHKFINFLSSEAKFLHRHDSAFFSARGNYLKKPFNAGTIRRTFAYVVHPYNAIRIDQYVSSPLHEIAF